jgi:predicted SAM-dependent methyltransferase
MTSIAREKCVVCGHSEFEHVDTIKDLPVFMGTIDKRNTVPYQSEDMKFVKCSNCSSLQLSRLLPLEVLYQSNHNIEVVGKTWTEHFQKFADFIFLNKTDSTILEIGCPSGKLAKEYLMLDTESDWNIAEPNPNEGAIKSLPENIKFKKKWLSELQTGARYGNIVMSHVFEHLYTPYNELQTIHTLLEDDGFLFISIPDMKHILAKGMLPPAGLNFEHTFYVDEENFMHLINRAGFEVHKKLNFNNHSDFYCCKKIANKKHANTDLECHNRLVCEKFKDIITEYKTIAMSISSFMSSTNLPVYMYGAHFPAQLLFSMGVNPKNIKGVLDNSVDKIGKKLYGTELKIYSPNILKENNAVVICHMGAYTKEIKNDILENINSKVIFI